MKKSINSKMILAIVWTVFTSSLAAWWMMFGLRQLNRVHELTASELVRQQKMLIWEGSILIGLLLLGGGSILYYMLQLTKANRSLKEFFATFSHELRTPIASLRLQAESLRDDWPSDEVPQLARLVQDSVRLQVQLENSLNLAQFESSSLFLQPTSIKKMLSQIHHQWPNLKINVKGNDSVYADERALHSVLTNLIQNAVIHGEATEVDIAIETLKNRSIKSLLITDNGKGFQGDWKKLSKLFQRHSASSGSGVGLYLVSSLITKMHGKVDFLNQPSGGFAVKLELPYREAT